MAGNADLFGFNEDAFDGTRETKNDTNPKTGLKTVVWQQEASGLPVIGAALKANFNREGGLIAVNGGLLPREVLGALVVPVAPAFDALRAVAAASVAVGAPSSVNEIAENVAEEKDGARFFRSCGYPVFDHARPRRSGRALVSTASCRAKRLYRDAAAAQAWLAAKPELTPETKAALLRQHREGQGSAP